MHSSLAVRTQRSANAFALGALYGVLMICTASAANTASKEGVNLVSRSWIRKRTGRVDAGLFSVSLSSCKSCMSQARFRACWVTQVDVG